MLVTKIKNIANGQNYTRNYTYSPIGNITAFNGVNYTYTDNGYNNPHAVTQAGSKSFTYDNNGNLTTDGTWTHTWNYNNTLASSTDGTNISSYIYDIDKSRLKLVEGTDTTIYPSPYYEVENGIAKINIQKDGKTIATKKGTTIEHIHTDHLGGTHVITDNVGSIVKTKDYYPFGNVRIDNGSSTEDNSFTGYEHDESTGLEYAEARYYNSELGRFISQDPVALLIGNSKDLEGQIKISQQEYLANPQTHNSYTYAFNNPVMVTDRLGKFGDGIFHNPLSFIGSAFWIGVSDFATSFTGNKYPEATRLLRRSILSYNPETLNLNNSDSLSKKILNSSEYNNAIDNIVGKYAKSNSVDFQLNAKNRRDGSFSYKSGDLFLGLGKVTIDSVSGYKKDEQWNLSVSLFDTYDFKSSSNDKAVSIPNNIAAGLQNGDVVSNYDIKIKLKHKKKIKK